MTLSPTLDLDLALSISVVQDLEGNYEYQYSLTGKHDGFPAFEVYINSVLSYTYNPRDTPAGRAIGLADLFFESVNVDTGFKNIPG